MQYDLIEYITHDLINNFDITPYMAYITGWVRWGVAALLVLDVGGIVSVDAEDTQNLANADSTEV